MPSIDEIQKKQKPSTFKKKIYRPWLEVEPGDTAVNENIASDTPTQNLVDTRTVQTPDKVLTEVRTNAVQTPDKVLTEVRTNAVQTPDKVLTERRTEVRTNAVQTPDKLTGPKSRITRFMTLTGKRKEITLFIYENCKAARSPVSTPFTIEALCTACKTTLDTADGTLRRLTRENFLIKLDGKKGRGAWRMYELPEDIYQEILRLDTGGQLRTNAVQMPYNIRTEHSTEHRTTPSSSSSTVLEDLKLTTQTQIEPDKKELPAEWEEIDFSCLESIGFKKHHLWQIYEAGKSSPDMVQESIYELAHDLKSGSQLGIKNPLALIMKNLKVNGIPYSAVTPGYENDEIRYQRKRIEELKRRQKLLAELKEEEEHLKSQIANDADEVNFQSWLKSKTEQEVKAITGSFVDPALPGGRAILKQAYQQEMASDPNSSLTREQVRAIMSAQLGDL